MPLCKCANVSMANLDCHLADSKEASRKHRQIPKLRISPLPPNQRKLSQMDGCPLHSSISKINLWINFPFTEPTSNYGQGLLILKISPGYEHFFRYTNSALCHLFTNNHVSSRKQDTWQCLVRDQSILVNAIHQGCKAHGGPMELIRWWESFSPDANRFQTFFFLWLAGSDCHQLAAKNSNHTYRNPTKNRLNMISLS